MEEKTHRLVITVEGIRDLYLDDLIKLVNDFAMENAVGCYWSKEGTDKTVVEVAGEK